MTLLEQYESKLKAESKPKSLLEMVEESMQTGLKEHVYEDYLSHNRPHQNQALEAIKANAKGQVIIPTGTGKTRIQIAAMVGAMLEKTRQGQQGIYVIASHRLLLNKQLMDEYLDLCVRCGLPINVLYIGSARHDEKAIYDKYFSQGISGETFRSSYTTVEEDVKLFYRQTMEAHRHLIIVSTYHSFHRLFPIEHIDMCCYDEAHNTTQDDFKSNIESIIPRIDRNYFFTATRKVCAIPGRGMENTEIYGDVLCDIGPRHMIEAGEIIRPRIMAMMLDNEKSVNVVSNKDQHMLVKTIQEAFRKNKEAIKGESGHPDSIGCKLLVSFVGSDELALVQDSEEFREWCQQQHIKVFSFSSRYGSWVDFEVEVNRDKVYEDMWGLQDEEDCILLHIDILAEGINLPSITGVLLLRHLNEVKLFQTLGRALRLMKMDRQRFYAEEITPENPSQYVKPSAYLILPMHFEGMETSSEEMRATIQSVIDTYGIPIEEFLPPEGFKARDLKMLDPVTDCRKISKTKKDYPLLTVIEDFAMDEFKKTLPSDPQNKYDSLMEALKLYGGSDA